MVKDAEANADKDKKARELVDAKNQAEQVVYQAEKALKENEGKLPADLVSQANSAIAGLKAATEKATSKEDIQSAIDKAQSVVGQILQAAQMAGASGGATGATGEHQHGDNCDGSCGDNCENKSNKGKDGPVDADFEVVDEKK
jgi:molecular chaperone DnaK